MKYSAARVDGAAEALAKAVDDIQPFLYERGMIGETEYERACLNLWKTLAAYKKAIRAR